MIRESHHREDVRANSDPPGCSAQSLKFTSQWVLGKGVTGAFAAGVTVLLVIGVFNFRKTNDMVTAASWTEHTQQVLGQIQAVWTAIDETRGAERGFALTGQEKFLQSYTSALREIGIDDFIPKPYRPAEVFDTMARHLGVRYTDRETQAAPEAGPLVALNPESLATALSNYADRFAYTSILQTLPNSQNI